MSALFNNRHECHAFRDGINPLYMHKYDYYKQIVLLWFSVACFGVRVSVTFHLMCVHIILSFVSVAERPPFGKSCSLV